MFVSWNIIGGLFIILIGISMLVKAIFGLDIPLVKIVIGLFLIYLGFTLVTDFSENSFKKKFKKTVNFSNNTVHITNPHQFEKYSIVFGHGIFDFSKLNRSIEHTNIKLRTVFGQTVIILDPMIPVKVSINGSFANVEMPDKVTASFGDFIYKTEAAKNQMPVLEIDATVVFGNLRIEEL